MPIPKKCPCLAMALCALPLAAAAGDTRSSLRLFTEYDDNVALTADGAVAVDEIGSTALGIALGVDHGLHERAGLSIRTGLAAFYKQQLEQDASGYDVASIAPRITLARRFASARRPSTLLASTTLRRDFVGGDGFSLQLEQLLAWRVDVGDGWSAGPRLSLAWIDFDDDTLDPALNSRDALRYTLGVGAQREWRTPSQRSARLELAAAAQRSDADGRNQVSSGWTGSARLRWPVRRGQLLLDAQWSTARYDDFSVLPRRDDDRRSFTVALLYPVAAGWEVDVGITRSDIDSTRDEFSTQRHLLRAGFTRQF